MEEVLREIFAKLDLIIDKENEDRRGNSVRILGRSKVLLLGQLSLLVDRKLSATLHLNATGDMDAKL